MMACDNHNQCVEEAFVKAEEICRKQAVRFTDLRQKVFAIIWQNHQPSKAYDILENLQKESSSAKPATVYRALDFLLQYGLIHKLHISNSYVTCSHPLRHQQCFFMICHHCNEVTECCDKTLKNELVKIGEDHHFNIDDMMVEIRGTCRQCAA